MREPTPERDIAEMMAAFAGPPPEDGVAQKLAAGLDLTRKSYRAGEFIGLPPAEFAARAYAACFGTPPAPPIFRQLQDRLLSGQVSQTALLRELAASGRGVRILGLRPQALRDAMAHSVAAALVLRAARLGRDISRLPRNLRRKLARKSASVAPDLRAAPRAPVPGRPRIAILSVAAGEKGGAERFFTGLCDALNDAGMAAELVTLESRENDFASVAASYRRTFDLDLSAYDGVISSKAPTFVVRHPNHVCFLMHTMRAWYDMFEASYPFASVRTQYQRRIIQALDSAALRAIPKRFAIGEEVAARLRAYNGLDAAVMHLPSTLGGLHEGPFEHVLMPGRLHPWKRVELAIAAMRHVASPIRLVIAGTGQEEARLRSLARRDPRIHFTGFVSEAELAALYAKSSSVLLLPRREDLGLVTFEAFAAAKPVITCSDSGEPARLVQGGQSGFVCPPDPRAIGAKIEMLAKNPDRAAAMGRAGQASVAQITWDRVARSLIAALGL